MGLSPQQVTRLHELIGQICNDSSTRAEFEQLAQWLDSDRDAQEHYVRYIDMHHTLRELAVGLSDRAQIADLGATLSELMALQTDATMRHADDDATTLLDDDSVNSKPEKTSGAPALTQFAGDVVDPLGNASADSGSPTSGTSAIWKGSLFLLVTVGAIACTAWWVATAHHSAEQTPHQHLVDASPPAQPVEPPAAADNSVYVARIMKASLDCVWGDQESLREFLLRVRAGDRLNLERGLAELEFHGGARIILHGPAIFTPTGPSAGHLQSGRLTGKVSDGDFRLTTPTAEVVDLGTEFGVAADSNVGTDVVVFDGRVQVASRSVQFGASSTTLDLTAGMATRLRLDGTAELGIPARSHSQFRRKITVAGNTRDNSAISLVDVIAGGNGFDRRLAGAIDPRTGMKSYAGQLRWQTPRSDSQFHPVQWHPMIDGVFIPSPEGNSVQIDSLGRKADLPPGSGLTWACIWARSKQTIRQRSETVDNDFWGGRTLKGIVERLEQVQDGLVGIHANFGITFDLQAMQLTHRRRPIEFRSAVVNLEASHEFTYEELGDHIHIKKTADLRVFVDGELRYSRLGFRREDGEASISVPLHAKDRFLTIISSDDGDENWDQVMLIDPFVVLAPQAESNSTGDDASSHPPASPVAPKTLKDRRLQIHRLRLHKLVPQLPKASSKTPSE